MLRCWTDFSGSIILVISMALTKHEEGSLRELWAIAYPLMLSSFSMMAMLFVDRIMLALYSTEALNATVNAATFGWAFIFSWFVLTGISEVFVAQHNGANQKHLFGTYVWQMIWLSIGSIFFFVPLSIWGSYQLYGTGMEQELERQYFWWMMLFGPASPLYAALCGFFIGQGKTRIITVLAIGANILNGIFDYILIFGIEGWVPSYGITGAAIATSVGLFFQIFVLAVLFFKKENRQNYGTANWAFCPESFWRCLKVGFPGALFVAVELFGWAAYYTLMTNKSENHIMVASLCQSIAILFFFFGEGINKAATAIAGNYIGGKKTEAISKMMIAGLQLHLIFFSIILFLFFIASDSTIELFMSKASFEQKEALYSTMKIGLFCVLFYTLFEGLRILISGVLTAAGDTVFLLLAGASSVWILLILPIYFFVYEGDAPIEIACIFCALYSLLASLIYLRRFLKGKWKSISIIN